MASAPKSAISMSTIREADGFSRLMINTMMGVGVGGAASVLVMTLKSPAQVIATGGWNSVVYNIVPYTTGAAILYTLGSGITREVRGTDDWRNEFVGGAVAGAFVNGIKRKSLYAAFVGSVFFGVASSAVQWGRALEANANSEKQVDKYAVALSPSDFGRAATASANVQRRLT